MKLQESPQPLLIRSHRAARVVASLKFLAIALDQPWRACGVAINSLLNTTTGFPAIPMSMGSECCSCCPRTVTMKTASAAARHGLRRPMERSFSHTLSFDDLEVLVLSALA